MNYFEKQVRIKNLEKQIAESEKLLFEYLLKLNFTNTDSEKYARQGSLINPAIRKTMTKQEAFTFDFLVGVLKQKNEELFDIQSK